MKAKQDKFLADKLAQYQSGQLNEEEKAIIEQWFEDKLNEGQPDFLSDRLKTELLKAELTDSISKAIENVNRNHRTENDITKNNKIDYIDNSKLKRSTGLWLKIAASILIVCGLSFYYVHPIKMGAQRNPVSYRTFTNSNAEMMKIDLQDGTEIWMNAATQIRVADNLSNPKSRIVFLDKGEAYFHVKRDPSRPFSITTGKFVTTVLGTSFNIKSYPELHSYQVAVSSGKVKVERISEGKRVLLSGGLVKDEVLNYSLTKNTFSLSRRQAALLSSWKTDGSLYFDSLTLPEIGAALERRYDIKVKVTNPDLAKQTYSMKLNHEPIQTILLEIARKTGMNYQLTNQKLTINPNPE